MPESKQFERILVDHYLKCQNKRVKYAYLFIYLVDWPPQVAEGLSHGRQERKLLRAGLELTMTILMRAF